MMKRSQIMLLLVALGGGGVFGGLAVQYKDVLQHTVIMAMAAVSPHRHDTNPLKEETTSQTAGASANKAEEDAEHQDHPNHQDGHADHPKDTDATTHDHPRHEASSQEQPTAPAHDKHSEPTHRNGAEPDAGSHGDHGDYDDHDEERIVRLSATQQQEFAITLGTAGPGKLQRHLTLPGEVALNADRRAHVVGRLPGIVRQVHKTLGDTVRAGEVLAVIDSRELAELQSAYLAAHQRLALSEVTLQRESSLWQQKITAEQDYLDAKQARAEAHIALRTAAQQLQALGFSPQALASLSPQADLTRYRITAPIDGSIIEKHISLGEALANDSAAFVVADLRSVWVDLKVYRKDLAVVRQGQSVVISAGQESAQARGTISYIGPLLGEQTRTALARVVLPNPHGHWRPGLFVTAQVVVEESTVPTLIPKTALQTIDDQTVVFVHTAEGFTPQPVTLGRSNDVAVEVTAGLQAGQTYVTQGAFTLKAQLAKGSFGDGHNH